MKRNMGTGDRAIRIIAGIAILATGVYFTSWWGAVGVIPLLTGLLGWCPAYVPFKLSTAKGR